MSQPAHTPLKSEQNRDGVASKSSGSKASSKTPINAANKKNGVNLTPVESLLFFNIVRFNKDPSAIDWVQVAKHSNLKNPGSAKVRFRQIQKKYGLEINATSRPGKRKTLATAAEDDEECEDDDDTDETPSKKLSNNLSRRGTATQRRASRKRAVVQKDLDSEEGSLVSTATDGPGPAPDPSVVQDHYERLVKDEQGTGIKQESPVRQMQMMHPRPTHPNGPSQDHLSQQHQQHQHQQQQGHEQLSHTGSASGSYSMDGTQHSGVGMFQGMSPFQHASSMADSRQSQLLTPQQQAYLQNLQRLHHERVSQQDPYMGYGHNEAQAQMTQQAGGQYGQYPVSATYAQLPQAYFESQAHGGGVQPMTRPPSRASTRASTQNPAISQGDDIPLHSSGDGSFAPLPESPIHPVLD